MDQKQDLFQNAPIKKAVCQMAVPTVISSLVLVIYNMADTFFIGQTHDALQVAAVSLTNAVFVMYMAVSQLLGIGGSAVISILLGQGEQEKVRKISSFCFYASLLFGVAAGALILLFMDPLLSVLGSNEATYQFSKDYLIYIAVGAPFILLANTFGHAVRGEGASQASMVGGMIGTVVNIILDPIFILVLNMGTAGAAIATVLGNVFGCVYYIYYLKRRSPFMSYGLKHLKGCRQTAGRVISVGVPAGISSALMSIATILLNNELVPYGDTAVAAMGVVTKVYLFIVFVHMGISNGIQPLLGYCYGAGNRQRFMGILKFSGILTIVCGSILTAVYIVFSRQIMELFIDDPQVISHGVPMLIATSLAGPILGLMFLSINSMQALNRPIPAALLSLCRQGLFFIPLLFLLNQTFGLDGINYTQTVSDYLAIIIALFMLVVSIRKAMPAAQQSGLAAGVSEISLQINGME
ncbi:MAG: MATE family efflux transporter [Clostridiales bacterium]|nr:MATE family efflux transporter [Clostridiales bacterium]